MRILIVGCNGLLGQNLLNYAPVGIELVGMSLSPNPVQTTLADRYFSVDITQRSLLEKAIAKINPDWIFNAAAMTHVDKCETEKVACQLLNRDCVDWMVKTGLPVMHVSTDYVFDGNSGPYSEVDKTNPLSFYGFTKWESEQLVLSQSPQSLVIRTMLLWGKQMGDKLSFPEFVKTTLQQNKPLRCAADQWGHPTLADDLAQGIWALWQGKAQGLFHICGSEYVNRLQWAEAIAKFYDLSSESIQNVRTADLNQAAVRPLKSGLRIEKFQKTTGLTPKNLLEQLQFVNQF